MDEIGEDRLNMDWRRAMKIADRLFPGERNQLWASERWEGAAAAAHYMIKEGVREL